MKYIIKPYLKFLGIIEILSGLTFSVIFTNNLFGVIMSNDIVPEGSNMFLMTLGMLIPISVFGLGLYTYFCYEFERVVNRIVFLSTFVLHIIAGIFYLMSTHVNYPMILKRIMDIFYFNNYSFCYILITIALASIYGYYHLSKNNNNL